MENILSEYRDIIIHYLIDENVDEPERKVFRCRIWFQNETRMITKDIEMFLSGHAHKRKYSYQWLDEDNQLIIRWDNAHHHPNLENFPFHKHIGETGQIVPSAEATLKDVLSYIRAQIQQ